MSSQTNSINEKIFQSIDLFASEAVGLSCQKGIDEWGRIWELLKGEESPSQEKIHTIFEEGLKNLSNVPKNHRFSAPSGGIQYLLDMRDDLIKTFTDLQNDQIASEIFLSISKELQSETNVKLAALPTFTLWKMALEELSPHKKFTDLITDLIPAPTRRRQEQVGKRQYRRELANYRENDALWRKSVAAEVNAPDPFLDLQKLDETIFGISERVLDDELKSLVSDLNQVWGKKG